MIYFKIILILPYDSPSTLLDRGCSSASIPCEDVVVLAGVIDNALLCINCRIFVWKFDVDCLISPLFGCFAIIVTGYFLMSLIISFAMASSHYFIDLTIEYGTLSMLLDKEKDQHVVHWCVYKIFIWHWLFGTSKNLTYEFKKMA